MSMLLPHLWSDAIVEQFKSGMGNWLRRPLDAGDVFQDENFSDAVAWAALLGITVLVPSGMGLAENFRLMKPGHAPVVVPLCSPRRLTRTLRDFAAGTLDTSQFNSYIADSIYVKRGAYERDNSI